MHTFSHIPTHSHTFFFHICLSHILFPHLLSHIFFDICCTHNVSQNNCWWPTSLGRAGGNLPIVVCVVTNQSCTMDPRVLRGRTRIHHSPQDQNWWRLVGVLPNSEITYSHNICNCILHSTVVSFCGVWRHSFFSGWSNTSTLCTAQLLF